MNATTSTNSQAIEQMRTETAELQKVYSEVEDMLKAQKTEIPAPSFLNPTLFASILAGLSGLLVGIAVGTTYIAPTL